MHLETERLLLRRFRISDYAAVCNLLTSSEVMKSSVSGSLDEQQTKQWLSEQIEAYSSKLGNEVQAVLDKNTSELIGYCGLFYFPDIDGVSEIEIGYRFVEDMWGNGYATEAASAILNYAFSELNLPRVIALIEPSNSRSIRVAEKLGMKFEKEIMLEDYDYPDHLYTIDKAHRNI